MACYPCIHCNKCGMYSVTAKTVCTVCGVEIAPDQTACPECGGTSFKEIMVLPKVEKETPQADGAPGKPPVRTGKPPVRTGTPPVRVR